MSSPWIFKGSSFFISSVSKYHFSSFDLGSASTQRLLIDILNLVFLANFLLGLLISAWKRHDNNGILNENRRRNWDSITISIVCILVTVSYFAGAGWILYRDGTVYKHWDQLVILSVRGLIWIPLSISISFHSDYWLKIILLIWWSTFSILITALNVYQLTKTQHLSVYDIIEWPATLLLLYHALKLIIKTKFINGRSSEESLSQSLLDEEEYSGSNIGGAGIFSRLTFSWLSPLFRLGNSRTLELGDIPDLDTEDEAFNAYQAFSREWDHFRRSKQGNKNLVIFALARCYKKEMILVGFYALLKSISIAVSPLILHAFVWYSNLAKRDNFTGLSLVGCLLIVKLVESLSQRHWFFDSRRFGMRMRSSVMAALYQKELKISSQARRRHSAGEIVNYIAVDAYRLGEFPWWFQMAWSLPLQLLFSVGILLGTVGKGALPGIVPLVIFGFLNIPVAKMLQHFQSEFMVAQDERLRSTSEVLIVRL